MTRCPATPVLGGMHRLESHQIASFHVVNASYRQRASRACEVSINIHIAE